MPSRRFRTLRRSITLLAVPLVLVAAYVARAEQKFEGTIVSACEGTIGCPNKINLKGAVDTLQFQALLNVPTPLHPGDDKFKIVLRNANGELLGEKLDPGSIVREGNTWVYRNDAARNTGGISRVTLRRLRAHQWRITVIAHGDLSGATLPQNVIYLVLGNDTFLTKDVWSAREFGWLLHLPATAPTPKPSPVATPTPVVTPTPFLTPGASPATPFASPTPTPKPSATPTPTASPTPTMEPYGSVFEAFVAAPSSLLQ
jgi:hypothetical protein